jgi:hypothetical protein
MIFALLAGSNGEEVFPTYLSIFFLVKIPSSFIALIICKTKYCTQSEKHLLYYLKTKLFSVSF